ncbi:ABC transporter ATP-binding protein [Brotaphodocola sp.]|uniref:ABC transporter ATP-binding protein n=1 Tax=Brotaphodocola sp. TaxID=3073577 RepID=UPI003D7EF9DF
MTFTHEALNPAPEPVFPVFSAEHLRVFRGGQPILNDLSFSIDACGTVTGLLGANGSGKTTLIRTICQDLAHSGTCRLNSLTLENLSVRSLARQISYIPQQTGISISMSVLDVVLMGFHSALKLFEHPSALMRKQAQDALRQTGMEDFADRDYLTLSGGQKQLTILARTLIENTTLLLLDEPDSSLDFPNRSFMLRLIARKTAEHKKTTLVCLHSPDLALQFCDQILLLKDGRVSACLHPKTDSDQKMENAFSEIYGPVRLVRIPQTQNSQTQNPQTSQLSFPQAQIPEEKVSDRLVLLLR